MIGQQDFRPSVASKRRHTAANGAPCATRREWIVLKRLLIAWLGAAILAVNLFGWIFTAQQAAPHPSPDDFAMADGMPMCEHGSSQTHSRPDDGGSADHGKMVCPACFPLGNAASGALAPAPSVFAVAGGRTIIERRLPSDWRSPSTFVPHRYRARAPPPSAPV